MSSLLSRDNKNQLLLKRCRERMKVFYDTKEIVKALKRVSKKLTEEKNHSDSYWIDEAIENLNGQDVLIKEFDRATA